MVNEVWEFGIIKCTEVEEGRIRLRYFNSHL